MRRFTQIVRQFRQEGDMVLLGLCLTANVFGLLLIFSATRYTPSLQGAVLKQLIAMGIGLCTFFLFTFLNMESAMERFHTVVFLLLLLLLLLLIPFGNDDGTGNRSWLSLPGLPFNLQPAELGKLAFVLLLSRLFARQQIEGTLSRPFSVLKTAGLTLLLCAVIFLASKDMGMVLVYLSIFLILSWIAGIHWGWFAGGLGAATACSVLVWPHLPSYIQMRLLVVLDHSLDPQGKGYQQLRSLLAIGSGQVSGQGYLQGVQTQSAASAALPARHTDFIFSVAGEELGLLGSGLILLLLVALLLRCVWIGLRAKTPFHAFLAFGLGGVLAVQTILNVGMCLYLAPVVGLTLPFFSYGGSSLITLYIAMGMLSAVKRRSGRLPYKHSHLPIS
jgi:rod shape determining protein RodA